jgi:UDP-3-O-[3-hydroxymyristoyl] N-acetylglucosamine deacetylase
MKQITLQKEVKCSGIGLHSGKKVDISLKPAPEDSGVTFLLPDRGGKRVFTPDPSKVVGTGLATTLGDDRGAVATVEHLLAAIAGLGIDNIQIEVGGREIPIMDGSAAGFVLLLRSAGLRAQAREKRVLAFVRPLAFDREGKHVRVTPYDGFRIRYTIDFDHPLVGVQRCSYEITPETFAREIARARTFGFLRDVEWLQRNGQALGGALDNAIVLDEYGVVNSEGLRFADEFVRHKVLDFIGDISLLGGPLLGSFDVACSGHALNNEFACYVHENRDKYLQEASAPRARRSMEVPVFAEHPEGEPAWA